MEHQQEGSLTSGIKQLKGLRITWNWSDILGSYLLKCIQTERSAERHPATSKAKMKGKQTTLLLRRLLDQPSFLRRQISLAAWKKQEIAELLEEAENIQAAERCSTFSLWSYSQVMHCRCIVWWTSACAEVGWWSNCLSVISDPLHNTLPILLKPP